MVIAHCFNIDFYWFDHDIRPRNWFNAIYLSANLVKQGKEQYRDLLLTLLLLGVVYWFKRWDILLIIAPVFILLGLTISQFRYLNHQFWKLLTKVLQLIFQPIIGALLFFLVLTPIGLLSQVFKKKKPINGSTFVSVERKFDADFFKKQW